MKKAFPNSTRTNRERRVRYCFLRQSGFSRETARKLGTWRDEFVYIFIEWLMKLEKQGVPIYDSM